LLWINLLVSQLTDLGTPEASAAQDRIIRQHRMPFGAAMQSDGSVLFLNAGTRVRYIEAFERLAGRPFPWK
jgi:hypothetical protein